MAISIGSRRELFWDYYLIDEEKTTATLSPNKPRKEGIVFEHQNPLGREIFYPVIFKDGEIFRMYYGTGFRYKDPRTGKFNESKLVTCYAESKDGIQWEFPNLGIYGDNNCILMHPDEPMVGMCVFKDTNPDCPTDRRYKGILRVEDGCRVFSQGGTLACFASEDGIHFRRVEDILREPGKYDSLNTVFWDQEAEEYKMYYRDNINEKRYIRLQTSKDFVNWTQQGLLEFDDDQYFQLYTNHICLYSGDSRMFFGMPVRYVERSKEWIPSFDALPDVASRKWRLSMHPRYAFALTDTLLMVSRDGRHWHKFNEAILDGGLEQPRTWKYGDTYLAYGWVEDENILRFYGADSAWDSDYSGLCCYSFRKDGCASFKSGWEESVVVTKPFIFTGEKCYLNFRTSGAGAIRIRLTDEDGNRTNSCEIFGNTVRREIVFEKPVSEFAGKPVVMELYLQDAEIYSIQFC